ncbi:hypothetical protein PHYBLDRAFT_149037 [Phycomyces blakesleeanus NRRL 1555(-)]|uniref:Tc1-like transposase DDE domain-containing protein n=1 Tax=Phycomyces blakesleeanus (strain ATCC 8743b / DSM 1359 / FGSC 10004 / NBRC 33097 / NRRL 1555) TaxID=763407 RepID=A0A162PKW8_PHYB8|nr:hypothetical protein PHYBLDRAFT_149037 [Phycomyces blakesleeanus NRRL 1555(-)]OAD69856.1 hypothetical protein PHYBLDRAFT_149037 [Phycomyces blakesleeanus NRRL 1555(-)]|eukprot:XP_018287896.1 hypothetical protein PHYBLDRAFT_149037 [Phycomyces blakesleeanus NRRL 1555(-)]
MSEQHRNGLNVITKTLKASSKRRESQNPSAVVIEVAESLTQNFADLNASHSTIYNFMTTECNLSIKQAQFQPVERNNEEKIQQRYHWVQKWQQTDLDFTTNCVFLEESAFHINLKRGMAWSKKGTPAVITVPTTKANATSILGAISATGLINATLDEMDKYPDMKGHYLGMDNAPIHSSSDIVLSKALFLILLNALTSVSTKRDYKISNANKKKRATQRSTQRNSTLN